MGFPGQNKIVDLLYKQFLHQPEGLYVNKKLINNIYEEYLLLLNKGYTPAKYYKSTERYSPDTYKMAKIIGNNLSISHVFILYFFYYLWDLTRGGAIPMYVIDPKGHKEKESVKSKLLPKNQILKAGKDFFNFGKNTLKVAVVGGTVAVVLYLNSKAKK